MQVSFSSADACPLSEWSLVQPWLGSHVNFMCAGASLYLAVWFLILDLHNRCINPHGQPSPQNPDDAGLLSVVRISEPSERTSLRHSIFVYIAKVRVNDNNQGSLSSEKHAFVQEMRTKISVPSFASFDVGRTRINQRMPSAWVS